MPTVGFCIVGIALPYFGFTLLKIWIYRNRLEKIIADKGLDPGKTFYSIASFKRLLLYTFTTEGLLIHFKTNVFFPNASLMTRQTLVKYDDIRSVEMGRATTTLKLKKTRWSIRYYSDMEWAQWQQLLTVDGAYYLRQSLPMIHSLII
jgi:hypothetical protein